MGGAASLSSSTANLKRKPSVVGRTWGQEGMAKKSRIFKKSITDDYIFSNQVVGSGFSGPVRLATHKQTNKECAVKRYDKYAADLERIDYLKSEAEVYLRLDHPNICKLFAIYEDERYLFIVMEYCAGQELYQRLHERKMYSENDAAEVTRQMVEAVHYLHSHHVVHRDLKLENWLYEKSNSDDGGRLKLIDFGFSKIWNPTRSQLMNASCGSLTYVSPDTLSGAYTNAVDMWSLGVTVYFLLVGVPPFFGTEKVIIDRILRGAYSMDGQRWARISQDGKDFVQQLLVIDPTKRMTSREALDHPWIVKCRQQMLPPRLLEDSVLHSLRQFALSSHLKRAALTMMAYSLTTKDIEELTSLFTQFDRNQDGCLSLPDFMEVMRENFNISNREIENLFNAMISMKAVDIPDSEVCYSDFVAALLQTRLRFHEDAIREAFLKFDADRSGYITADDLRQVIGDKFEGVDIDEVVRAADVDGDGRIVASCAVPDYEEFLAAVLAEVQADGVVAQSTMSVSEANDSFEEPMKTPAMLEVIERKRRVLRQLLGVVDSNLAGRNIIEGPKMMTRRSKSMILSPRRLSSDARNDIPCNRVRRTLSVMPFERLSQSSPHIIRDVFEDFESDPRTPHARPWDSRLERICDGMSPSIELPNNKTVNSNEFLLDYQAVDDNMVANWPQKSSKADKHDMENIWSQRIHSYTEVDPFVNSVKNCLIAGIEGDSTNTQRNRETRCFSALEKTDETLIKLEETTKNSGRDCGIYSQWNNDTNNSEDTRLTGISQLIGRKLYCSRYKKTHRRYSAPADVIFKRLRSRHEIISLSPKSSHISVNSVLTCPVLISQDSHMPANMLTSSLRQPIMKKEGLFLDLETCHSQDVHTPCQVSHRCFSLDHPIQSQFSDQQLSDLSSTTYTTNIIGNPTISYPSSLNTSPTEQMSPVPKRQVVVIEKNEFITRNSTRKQLTNFDNDDHQNDFEPLYFNFDLII